MKTVYLAGPITGLTYDEGQDWRTTLEVMFRDVGMRALSPLRGKSYLKTFGKLEDQYIGVHPLSDQKGITTRDRNDCMRSDVVIANFLGAERVSIGTVLECAWADAARVPLIVVMEEENVHQHAMIREVAGYVVDNLDDAFIIAVTVLGLDASIPAAREPKPVEKIPLRAPSIEDMDPSEVERLER